jgi:hypothetical protein
MHTASLRPRCALVRRDVVEWANAQARGATRATRPARPFCGPGVVSESGTERRREPPSPVYVSGRRALDGGDARPNGSDGGGHSQRTPALLRIALSLQRGWSRRSSSYIRLPIGGDKRVAVCVPQTSGRPIARFTSWCFFEATGPQQVPTCCPDCQICEKSDFKT